MYAGCTQSVQHILKGHTMQRDAAQEKAMCALLTQPVLCFWRCIWYITVSHGFAIPVPSSIYRCTALLLPSDLPCSLPTSLVLAPQLYSTCSCPTVPAMPFLQLCQIPFLSIAIMLFNCKFLIFTKLTHHIDPVFCGIFHKKYLSDTKQKILMSSLCLEIETQ